MRNRNIAFCIISLFCAATLPVSPAQGDARGSVRTDTPSGYPVPRFVALKGAKTYCRSGPSKRHPIRFTYYKKGAPVLVVAETVDHWRKIRDRDGDECWAHKSVLRAAAHAFSLQEVNIRARPEPAAAIRGRIARDVLVRIEKERNDWARISAGAVRGWVRKDALWGLPETAVHIAVQH